MIDKKNKKIKTRKQFKTPRLFHLTVKNTKTMFRDRTQLIWLIGYPLLIIFIFSLAFGGSSGHPVYNIAILNDDTNDSGFPGNPSEFSEILISVLMINGSDFINIKSNENNYTDNNEILTSVEDDLKYERISAIIFIPTNFTEDIYTNRTPSINIKTTPDQVVQGVISSIVQQIVDYIIISYNNGTPCNISLEVFSNTVKITNFDWLAPGYAILGVTVCISQMAMHFAEEKEKGTLKRLCTTPVARKDILLSGMASQLIVAAFQIILILLLLWLFGAYFHPQANLFLLFGIPMLFTFTSLGFGLILASFVKNQNSAGGFVWFVILPLQFLGGLFFPFNNSITQYIPTSYAAHAMRSVMINGVTSWSVIGTDILVVLGFGIITSLIGILLFQRKRSIL
ncbi:MAG: ABC transporter permease [Candidatus Lokiarchaeota archaeon]|nr:ABC transporter permease [Candidatus Lokiarchaeota archaeon]